MATVTKTGSFKELTALSDAEGVNNSPLNVKQYKDLDLFFTKRSRDKDVNILTNVTAVKRAVRNLILTNFYEKPFHPEIGCGIRGLLFENATPLTSIALSQAAADVIANYEPRALVLSVDVRPDLDRNAYDMTVTFMVVNQPAEQVSLNVLLEVLR
tara:strand:+ start:942 stop:1409 length:468 start_codon:yes stop_codon:yes gene_type:complete